MTFCIFRLAGILFSRFWGVNPIVGFHKFTLKSPRFCKAVADAYFLGI